MTDTELIKKSICEFNIDNLIEQAFEAGFQAGYEEAISQIRYKFEEVLLNSSQNMESEE